MAATTQSLADVVAGVGNVMAAYTQALDDGRAEDVVATFCPDGSCDMPGLGRHEGHDALRAAYEQWKPRKPQRHLITNMLVAEWNDAEARVTSDVVFLMQTERGWAVGVVGRYDDVLHLDGGNWRFHSRVATFVTENGDT
jgi:hypothetical protein